MSVYQKSIEEMLQTNMGNYSFNINLFRAFPNVNDGLKIVARRVLYGMGEMKLTPGVQHRKVAGVVGKVLADTHPHGDSSVADALVKMSQDFYMKVPTVDISGK